MSDSAVSFTAVLLAGGQSRRMNVDKAGLMHKNGLTWPGVPAHALPQNQSAYFRRSGSVFQAAFL